MALDRASKEKLLDDYNRRLRKRPHAFVLGYRGMTVPQVDATCAPRCARRAAATRW